MSIAAAIRAIIEKLPETNQSYETELNDSKLSECTDELSSIASQVQALEDQVAKIPALEATAKAVTDTDLAHKATQTELSTAHQKISDLEHQVVRCRNAGAELQRQADELATRNANLEKAAEVANGT